MNTLSHPQPPTGSEPAGGSPNVLGQVLVQRQRVAERLASVRRVFAVMSGKGGVGKSAITANVAAALAMQGRAVGVLDADLHGASAATMLGARGQQLVVGPAGARPAVGVAGVKVISMDLFLPADGQAITWNHPGGLAADTFVWRGALEANVLREFLADTDWGALDTLLIDMPPGADRFETLLRLVPNLDGALVVTIPTAVSYLVVHRAISAARSLGAPILGLVENMTGLNAPAALLNGRDFAASMNVPYLGGVPFDPNLAATTDSGRPFVLEHSETPAGRAILALVEKIETEFLQETPFLNQ